MLSISSKLVGASREKNSSANAPMEAVAWRYRYPNDPAWQLTLDRKQAHDKTYEAQPLYTHPAPIQPSADTGELRGEVIAAVVANVHVSDGRTFINGPAIADAILDLIQSERGSSPIGQNDQPGLAFSDAGEQV